MKNLKIITILALLIFLFSFNSKKEKTAALSEINSAMTLHENGDNMTLHNNVVNTVEVEVQKYGTLENKEVINILPNTFGPTISITKPEGGVEYCMFQQQYIEWETLGVAVPTISIYLMHSNGQTINRTIASNIPNNGRFLWDSAASNPGNYLVRISGMSNVSIPSLITGETEVFTLKDCQKPDLRVGHIEVTPQSPGEGQMVTYKGNVMNYGENPVVNPVVTLKVERPEGLPTRTYREEMDVTLTKNQGVTYEKKFRVPKPGSYKTTFTLDPADLIDEMEEENNDKEWTFGVHALPDIILCISNGKRPPVGRSREIRMVVKNIGNANTDAVAGIKLRSYVKGKGVKIYDIPPLAPGATYTVKRNHKWGLAGTKSLSAKIIYTKNEIKTNNNEVQGSFFVRLPHHDTYSAAPKVKCSTGKNFYSWEEFEN